MRHPVHIQVYRETSPTAHKKIDRIEMNIKVPYDLAILAIIIEILIFEVVLMRARREKRSSRSRHSPSQFIKQWLSVECWRGKRESAQLLSGITAHISHCIAPWNSRRWSHNRDY